MKEVLAYLATLTPPEREAFAARCGTTVGYLRKAASVNQRIGEHIAIALERESKQVVTVEQLRPDVDWAYIRNTPAHSAAQPAATPITRAIAQNCNVPKPSFWIARKMSRLHKRDLRNG